MGQWDDTKATLDHTTRYGEGQVWRFTTSGLLIADQQSPVGGDRGLIDDVFTVMGGALRAAATEVPIELLAACVCTETAERVGAAAAPSFSRDLPEFIDEATTPSSRLVGCTGLRLDIARGYGVDDVTDPQAILNATAMHITSGLLETRFQPPMVAGAYNGQGLRYDQTSPWRLASFDGDETRISRFCSWFQAALTLCLGDTTAYGGALSFAAAVVELPVPAPPGPSAVTASAYRKPESQAAIDAGMMTICGHNTSLNATWALDDVTTAQIKGVANDSASGLGLPGGFPFFAYPDRGGTQRIMTEQEVQDLYRTMRDYVSAIRVFDADRAPALPGQPAFMP